MTDPTLAAPNTYPTGHVITKQTQEEANHEMTIPQAHNNTQLQTTMKPITQWANAIIDPEDTGASME
jgi:hypothetical protein